MVAFIDNLLKPRRDTHLTSQINLALDLMLNMSESRQDGQVGVDDHQISAICQVVGASKDPEKDRQFDGSKTKLESVHFQIKQDWHASVPPRIINWQLYSALKLANNLLHSKNPVIKIDSTARRVICDLAINDAPGRTMEMGVASYLTRLGELQEKDRDKDSPSSRDR